VLAVAQVNAYFQQSAVLVPTNGIRPILRDIAMVRRHRIAKRFERPYGVMILSTLHVLKDLV